MAAALEDRPSMSDREAGEMYEALNRMEGAIATMRQFVHGRDRAAVDCQLGNLREALDAELTIMETAGVPWSDKHQSPPSIEELRGVR